ncbi:rhodanese-like domain-containing protein [Georgenia sp. SUBG003]|uniref:rhodanese-like domain-containing protein n=1 Tax=Georgenia sp. SUBG003 TaxID=1497974 RepID=UPI003AB5464A
MTEVSIDQLAAAKADGAFVVDVREPGEYVQGHVAGAELVPLSEVPAAGRRPADAPARLRHLCKSAPSG